jgi:hypothetical protein
VKTRQKESKKQNETEDISFFLFLSSVLRTLFLPHEEEEEEEEDV